MDKIGEGVSSCHKPPLMWHLRGRLSTILLSKAAAPQLTGDSPHCMNEKGATTYWQFATDRYLRTTVKHKWMIVLNLFSKKKNHLYLIPNMDYIPTKSPKRSLTGWPQRGQSSWSGWWDWCSPVVSPFILLGLSYFACHLQK